jgi:hypothetical protein
MYAETIINLKPFFSFWLQNLASFSFAAKFKNYLCANSLPVESPLNISVSVSDGPYKTAFFLTLTLTLFLSLSHSLSFFLSLSLSLLLTPPCKPLLF